jgi:hypothetical protein
MGAGIVADSSLTSGFVSARFRLVLARVLSVHRIGMANGVNEHSSPQFQTITCSLFSLPLPAGSLA